MATKLQVVGATLGPTDDKIKAEVAQYFAENPTKVDGSKVCPHTDFDSADFVQADAQFWSLPNTPLAVGAKYRVSCKREVYYQYPRPVYIKAQPHFQFAIGYYADSVCTSNEGWATEKIIPANQRFRIMIARVTESTSEVADVALFVSKINILTEYLLDLTNRMEDAEINIGAVQPPKPLEVLSINHRGYNGTAPENTLPAFKLSKKNGFDFVETDIRFTSDGVPVLLHDPTINRTARNVDGTTLSETVNINAITYGTALTYDFGVWKGAEYAGTKIPTLTEFLTLCRALSLHPYLDVYDCNSETKAQTICDTIITCGMTNNVTFVCSGTHYAEYDYLAPIMPKARYGLITWSAPTHASYNISKAIDKLRGYGVPGIFVDIDMLSCDIQTFVSVCKENRVALEVYSLNTEAEILALDPYITGVTSDLLVAKDVLREANL